MTSEFGDDALLQDALYELSLAKPAPDASVLEDLVRSYPQFAQELTEAAVELRLDALKGRDEEPLETNPEETRNAVLKAMSRFHNRLHALRARRFTKMAETLAAGLTSTQVASARAEAEAALEE